MSECDITISSRPFVSLKPFRIGKAVIGADDVLHLNYGGQSYPIRDLHDYRLLDYESLMQDLIKHIGKRAAQGIVDWVSMIYG